MGYRNVAAVMVSWRHLTHRAMRALVWMALHAKDDDDPPLYFGGRRHLAIGLGRVWPDGTSPEDAKERNSIETAVKQVRRELRTAGAIETAEQVPGVRTTTYALRLLAPGGVIPATPQGVTPATPRGEDLLPEAVTPATPYKKTGIDEALSPRIHLVPAQSETAREASTSEDAELDWSAGGHPFQASRRGADACRLCTESAAHRRHQPASEEAG